MSRTGAVTSSAPADTKNGRIFTKEDFQSWEIPCSSDNNFRRTYFSHHTTEKIPNGIQELSPLQIFPKILSIEQFPNFPISSFMLYPVKQETTKSKPQLRKNFEHRL